MPKASPVTGSKFKRTNIKPQRSRALIRRFHNLLRAKARLEAATGALDRDEQGELQSVLHELDSLGGLRAYQEASISGQDNARGGDSSRILVRWLKTDLPDAFADKSKLRPRLLEVGCLYVRNACTLSGIFAHIDRLDLNSQDPLIDEQDFMDRPLPTAAERYDIVSLSLVLNYVPDPLGRGKMLLRVREFLVSQGYLFFVLPAPCVLNSRYCTVESLEALLLAIGFSRVFFKKTEKIVYWLFRLDAERPIKHRFPKVETRPGAKRNNFCVTL